MSAILSFATLVRLRWGIYCGGLTLILGMRSLAAPSTSRRFFSSLLLGVMVLTYAGELWVEADERPARPVMLIAGIAGVVVGIWLALGGSLPGLLFTGGGLLFLNRSMTGRGETSS
ncbi:hypothetical protein [Natronomonas sp. LN261]|jgi:uncharacterized membrane protein HdeD (DUF308 family)|uniref:hypothetical protein n=1 Tax=Natronomonas sp. LN261 TaxID=2750669 RepID=UPI0015EE52DB|nr:hypothetical protein [Natronomonas sp. LN261]